jgi:integrase
MGRQTVYNNITSPEKIALINKKNISLLDEWMEYLHSVDRSEETIEQYRNDALIFFCWLIDNGDNKFFIDITKRDVMRFQNWLLNTLKVSSSRIRRLKSTLSSMSNYILNVLDEEYPDFKSIINKIPAPVLEPVREKTVLQDEEVERVLGELVSKGKNQMACVLALAAYSGSRKSELLRFKVSYFNEDNIVSGLFRTPERIKTKGRGKAGKLLNKFVIAKPFQPYLSAWIEERKQLGVPSEIDDLFVAKDESGEEWIPMKISTLDSWAEYFSELFKTDFYFHCLRHYFTTSMYKAGVPMTIIKDVVGWANIGMCDTYIDRDVTEELEKYFDSEGIKFEGK